MKKTILILSIIMLFFAGCTKDDVFHEGDVFVYGVPDIVPNEPELPEEPGESLANETITVNGVSFTMIAVEGGTFQMGATSEQGSDADIDESPVHSVTLSDYYIGETEVTQELWEAVMGSNPSYFSGYPQRPVEKVSWNDCQEFITKLNNLTGKKFRLPTEAEWEYAARGGNKSKGYKYSGSNTIVNVAWYWDNSSSTTHDVKTKQANELGIYDMSGNVWEWCQDWYGSNYYSNSPSNNPTGPSSGSHRVRRGGGWLNPAMYCRVSFRGSDDPGNVANGQGLRLSLSQYELELPEKPEESLANETITVNGGSFTMIAVEGGTFQMGATLEQGSYADDNEKPVHSVTLSDYYIGETEVTQELWEAVMGSNPSYFSGYPQRPVECVSWNNCQEFITKLNDLTGKNFRLPTEAEWEYAARGGNKSKGYKYSGSDTIVNVAWYWDNSSSTTHDVKTKQANELGIYDMSGNVWEWCQDWYDSSYYSSSPSSNPKGPASGSHRVRRGGGWLNAAKYCRVSFRGSDDPGDGGDGLGLRLSLSQYEPELPEKPEESLANETITVNGVSFTMIAVEGGTFKMGAQSSDPGGDNYDSDATSDESPVHDVTLSSYYIGETEVTQELWEAVMGSNPSYFSGYPQRPVEKVSWNDCQEFITKLNNLTGKKFRLPTEAEWEYAARGGNKSKGYKYSGSNTIDNVAWYTSNSGSETHDVKTKQANELGIYDMSGNVWEWCQDWYGSNYYSNSPSNNPTGPSSGSLRVLRGGSWSARVGLCRVSHRDFNHPDNGYIDVGFRLILQELQ